MKQVCATCDYALGFTLGPGISGPDEGVECANPDLVKFLDRIQKSDSYQREYREHGFIKIFRVEAVSSGDEEQCQFWAQRKAVKAK